MSQRIVIENEVLRVEISSYGAEIQSVQKNGEELFWEGDPAIWSGHSPILFPICGGLKEDRYSFSEKEYTLPKHGFARKSEFLVDSAEKTCAAFSLRSSEETKKVYPFEFCLTVTYQLEGEALFVRYDVQNLSEGTMYFSIGSHEAYACPNGIEEYSVIFEHAETLNSVVLEGNTLSSRTVCIGENVRELPLSYDYFAVDALVFTDLKSRMVTLQNRRTGKKIKVEFPGADYFLLWTKPQAGYICIEPWCGCPDYTESSYDITQKRGMIALPKGEACTKKHTITF